MIYLQLLIFLITSTGSRNFYINSLHVDHDVNSKAKMLKNFIIAANLNFTASNSYFKMLQKKITTNVTMDMIHISLS